MIFCLGKKHWQYLLLMIKFNFLRKIKILEFLHQLLGSCQFLIRGVFQWDGWWCYYECEFLLWCYPQDLQCLYNSMDMNLGKNQENVSDRETMGLQRIDVTGWLDNNNSMKQYFQSDQYSKIMVKDPYRKPVTEYRKLMWYSISYYS